MTGRFGAPSALSSAAGRRQLRIHRNVQALGAFAADGAQRSRGVEIALAAFGGAFLHRCQCIALVLDQLQPLGHALAQQRQVVGIETVLAGDAAEREQALLDCVEILAVEVDRLGDALQQRRGVLRLDDGALDRGARGLQHVADPVGNAVDMGERRAQLRLRGLVAVQLGMAGAERRRDGFGVLE